MASRSRNLLGRLIKRITRHDHRGSQEPILVGRTPARATAFVPPVAQKVIGLLQDQKTKAPLVGYTVRVADLDAEKPPESLGSDTTDARGLFRIAYTTPRPDGGGGAGRRLRLQVIDRQARRVAEIDVTVKPGQKPPLVVGVDVPAPPAPASPTVEEVARAADLAVPPALTQFLEQQQIRTLEDVRNSGGLASWKGLPVPADDPAVKGLDAHANLSVLSDNVALNRRLIEKGFDSVVAIAGTTRQRFVGALSGEVGDVTAGQLQTAAVAQTRFLRNVDAELRASLANGGVPTLKMPNIKTLYPPKCACPDCDAAVSPLAYLADLLDYALRHLTVAAPPNPAQPITLAVLTNTFCQPFGELPAACEELDREVPQVQLCVEVLRRYLAANPPPAAAQQPLDAAERAYRGGAYTAFLARVGGPYGDVRLARTAQDPVRQSLADRLGIDLVAPRPDHLDALFLDPGAPAGDPREVTEPTLERLLGLTDTRRNPLAGGAKQGDPQNQVPRWNFIGATWNRNTDGDGFVYLRLAGGAGAYTVEVFRDSGRAPADRVALGSTQAPVGLVTLAEDNASGLSGRVRLNYVADADAVAVNLVPNLLSWRLARLRTLWRQQDWPVDRYQDAFLPADQREPFIDPDVVGPDDFRIPMANAAPFALWLQRRTWVDARLQAFAGMRRPDGTPDLDAMIASMYVPVGYGAALRAAWANTTQPADLEPLERALAQGQGVEAARQRIRADLNLGIDAFTRLVALRREDRDARADPRNGPVSPAGWREVYSILAQAWKTAYLAEWRAEEAAVSFGPETFWPALREPQQGDWPPAGPVQAPLIDPEVLALADLLAARTGKAAVRLWQRRRAILDLVQADIRGAREAGGFDAMVGQAVGDPNPGDPLPSPLADLIADLDSGDPARVANARTVIQTRLFLTLDEFNQLAAARARDAAGPPLNATLWAGLYALLTTARKLKQLYAGWRQEESRLPLIDPDDLKQADLPEPTAGAGALALWRTRVAARGVALQDLQVTREANGFDAMLRRALGDPNPGDPLPHGLDLNAVQADLTSGDPVRTSQAQVQITSDLYMAVEAFGRLVAVKARSEGANSLRQPTAADWADVYAILASAQKEKRAYPAWVQEEQDPVTGVGYWAARKAALPLWRAGSERRGAWRQALQARSQPPLIDPDLIGPGDLRDPTSGPAFDLWQARRMTIVGWLNDARNTRAGAPDLARFDAVLAESLLGPTEAAVTRARLRAVREAKGLTFVLRQLLGEPPPDLAALAAGVAANDVAARVRVAETLYLDVDGFPDFVRIYRLDAAGRPVTPAQWDQVYNLLTLGTLVRTAMSPADAQQRGEDISGRLDQLSLSPAAFTYLVRFRDAAARRAPLLASEWDDVYSILAQVRKRRAAARWRGEEAPGIVLGPDRFRLPDPPAVQIPPDPPTPLPAWRALAGDRQDWQDGLQARVDQEAAVIAAYRDALAATEAEALPGLRDALVLATRPPAIPPAAGLPEKARWVTDHLLIDAEAGGCQRTTRIAQAIETVQGVLRSVRAGLLADAYPQLALDADDFDDEWAWIGSYATWRAAMFVFLYPENLLLPGLRRHQTPAFRQLVSDLRANQALGPEQACEAARRYADYFRDVANLTLVAACQAPTQLHTPDCRRRAAQGERPLLYLFATGAATRTVYWSTCDLIESSSDPGYAQSSWEPVPGLDPGVAVLAAVPYAPAGADPSLLLFAHDRTQQKLLYAKYNLASQQWLGAPNSLDPPKDLEGDLTVVVKQRCDESEAPYVAVQAGGRILSNQLNRTGDGWADEKWTVLGTRPQQLGRIVGMVGLDGGPFYLFAASDRGRLQYRCFGNPGDPFWHPLADPRFPESWAGAFAWPQSNKVYAFYHDDNTGSSLYQRLQPTDVPPQEAVSPAPNPPAGVYPQSWSFGLLDLWLGRACGVQLSTLAVADVANLGGETRGTVLELLSLAPGDPPRSSYPGNIWETAVLARLLEGLGKLIKNSEDWGFADDLVYAASGQRLIPIIGAVYHQAQVTLPDGAKGAAALGDLLQWLFGGQTADPYYQPPVATATSIYGLRRVIAHSPTSATPAPIPDTPQQNTILTACQKDAVSGQKLFWSAWTRDDATDLLTPAPETAVAPLVPGPFDIVERLSGPALQVRRQEIEDDWSLNAPGPRSNLTYLEEAYYFVPVQLALQLQQRGHYSEALDWFRTVYDYSAPADRRKIYNGLTQEHSLPTAYTRAPNWLLDPLNPHAIAEARTDSYTRYTLLSLTRCLLQYADAEFTTDTAESVPRARDLYMAALDLLETPELQQRLNGCDQVIGNLEIDVGGPEWVPIVRRVRQNIARLADVAVVEATVAAVGAALRAAGTPQARLDNAFRIERTAFANVPAPPTYADALAARAATTAGVSRALLAVPVIARAAAAAGASASQDFLHALSSVTGISEAALVKDNPALPWLRNGKANGMANDLLLPTGDGFDRRAAILDPLDTLLGERRRGGRIYVPAPAYDFCIPPNPVPQALRLRAELNLYKLRTCRNIAGVRRELDPYAAPTDTSTGLPLIGPGGQLQLPGAQQFQPTPYRYRVLIDRAKQLAQMAGQVEAAMLAALEKRDAEYYAQLKARQDLRLTQAGLRLQDLRVNEAQDGVTLARLQQQRAQIQADHYEELLKEGISSLEEDALSLLGTSATFQLAASLTDFGAALVYLGLAGSAFWGGVSPADAVRAFAESATTTAAGLSTFAGRLSTLASIQSTLASYERRQQDWEFLQTLAQQDVAIGAQQVTIAEDQVRVAGQERVIAQMQSDNAKETFDFLSTKFTNAELYDWMSNVLGGVYSYFLQQATAVARLAEGQLGFERHEAPPAFIQADYWDAPGDFAGGIAESAQAPDRRGLTGSSRLLEDVQRLDEYAFTTDKRKLQLTKVFSLARQAPAEFQRFRETGVLTFATPMELFDRDFPGHYLRLIKRVRVSVIALIPPTQGVRATLSSAGISRVIVGGDVFQTEVLRRDPETVALSSPQNATGLFDLEPQPDMLLPFEGTGVDTRWEFRMPRPANLLDYTTIADVLLTVDYTALNSFDYRQQVIQALDRPLSADLPFSFRNELADAWYDLHNPDQSATPMTVRFPVARDDLPPNLENIRIQQLVLYFARKPGSTFEVDVVALRFTEDGGGGSVGGGASTSSGVISTRTGGAGSWTAILGKSPLGEFELVLGNDPDTRRLFSDELVEDILFVITYTGRTPDWPA